MKLTLMFVAGIIFTFLIVAGLNEKIYISNTSILGNPTQGDKESEQFRNSLNLKFDEKRYRVTSYKRSIGTEQLSWVAITSKEKNTIFAGILDGSKIPGFTLTMKNSLKQPKVKSELLPIRIQGETYTFSRLVNEKHLNGDCNRKSILYSDHITTTDNLWIVVNQGIITEKCKGQKEETITKQRISPRELQEIREILESINRSGF